MNTLAKGSKFDRVHCVYSLAMIVVGNKLLSEDIFDVQFSCDISACQGACCVEGSGGAPLTEEECAILDDVFEDVKPFLRGGRS